MDVEEFRVAAKQLVDYIADYLENIRDRPVLPSVEPFYIRSLIPEEAPEEGEPWSNVFKDIERVIMPGVSFASNSVLIHAFKICERIVSEQATLIFDRERTFLEPSVPFSLSPPYTIPLFLCHPGIFFFAFLAYALD